MSSSQAPLSKQIAGAVIGAALALVLYIGYTALEPQLQNFAGVLITPQARLGLNTEGDVRIASTNIDENEVSRIASRARQIANEFGQNALVEEMEEAPIAMPEEFMGEGMEEGSLIEDLENAWEELEEQKDWEEENLEFEESEPDFYGDTDELTDSGVGMWLASIIALLGALYLLRRKKLADCA